MWIFYSALYGFFNGFYAVFRKKSAEKTNVLFVLALMSTVGFLLSSWYVVFGVSISAESFLFLLLKSAIVCTAWVLELYALKDYFISVLQPLSAVRVVLAFLLAIIVFSEQVFWWQFIGVIVIFIGILLLRTNTKNEQTNISNSIQKRCIILYLIACICQECSSLIDKFTLQTISSYQMQFWFMLFVAIFLWICFFVVSIKHKKLQASKSDLKNIFIYLAAIMLFVGDQFLFRALNDPASKLSVASMLKQISIIVSVVVGGLVFKEPNLKKKLIFLAMILVGIIIVLI